MNDVRLSSKEKRIGLLHERAECGSDVVMPVRHGPATVLEATFGVFVGAAGSLHYTIEGKEF